MSKKLFRHKLGNTFILEKTSEYPIKIKIYREGYEEYAMEISVSEQAADYAIRFLDNWEHPDLGKSVVRCYNQPEAEMVTLANAMIGTRIRHKQQLDDLSTKLREFFEELSDEN